MSTNFNGHPYNSSRDIFDSNGRWKVNCCWYVSQRNKQGGQKDSSSEDHECHCHVLAVHWVVFEPFQSEPKWWTDRLADQQSEQLRHIEPILVAFLKKLEIPLNSSVLFVDCTVQFKWVLQYFSTCCSERENKRKSGRNFIINAKCMSFWGLSADKVTVKVAHLWAALALLNLTAAYSTTSSSNLCLWTPASRALEYTGSVWFLEK